MKRYYFYDRNKYWLKCVYTISDDIVDQTCRGQTKNA